jgi:hypothetical protein
VTNDQIRVAIEQLLNLNWVMKKSTKL